MKKTMFSLVLAVVLSATAQAQTSKSNTPADRAKVQTERMAKELDLTPEQRTKVEAINLRFAEKASALREERKTSPGEHQGEGKEMKAEREAELRNVLTPEQLDKWTAHEKAMMEKRRSG
ncbi:MAG TPA: hypothetical protein VGE21_03425, partial [Flavobacteriales bacterium]